MKQVGQKGQIWQYTLNPVEADMLASLLKQFPLTSDFPAKISKSDTDPKSAEREKLLNESLAEHRKELKKRAVNLVTSEKLRPIENGRMLTLSAEERENMLQILNDIRIGAWRALGKPETMESPIAKDSTPAQAYHHLMNLAGYFVHHLVGEGSD